MVLTLKKFVFKFRCMQDILIDQLKVMFDFSNKGWVTLFKQSKCLIETILWFYDSTTCLPLFFYSSAVNYISFKCERPKNCTKIISGKHNTVLTWRQLFHFFFLLQGLNHKCFEHGTTAYCLLPPDGSLAGGNTQRPAHEIVDVEVNLADKLMSEKRFHLKTLFIVATNNLTGYMSHSLRQRTC